MATFRDLVTLVKFYRYFRGVVTFGIPCETSHARDFVISKSHAREKPLLAEYSDQFWYRLLCLSFPSFLAKKEITLCTFEVASFVGSLFSEGWVLFGICEILWLLSEGLYFWNFTVYSPV